MADERLESPTTLDTKAGTRKPRVRRTPPQPSQPSQRIVLDPMLVVPLVDQAEAGRIYDAAILRFAVIGGLVGGLVLGILAWLIASGSLPVAGLGQFGAAGAGVAAFTGAGIGLAAGALLGGVTALCRLPSRRPAKVRDERGEPAGGSAHEQHSGSR